MVFESKAVREILFRGKRKDNGEWAYGFYNEFANRATGEQEHFIQTVRRDGRIDYIRKVGPETVGQFTGLTDMNDERIFEGDIIKETDIIVEHEIQIRGQFWEAQMRKGVWAGVGKNDWDFLFTLSKNCEVIGNIHDNPELMEASNG